MGRVRRDNEENFVKVRLRLCGPRNGQMSQMNRVKGASEDPYARCVTHGFGPNRERHISTR